MSTHKKTSTVSKFVSGAVGFATALVMSGGAFVHTATAQTVEELQAQIASLLSTIQGLQSQLSALQGGTGSTGTGYTFSTNLSLGDRGADVLNLQKVLNMDADTRVAASGAGSPGNETEYFGALTRAAVVKFQNKYASEILAPLGLTTATGFVGPSTRAKLNALSSAPGVTPPSTPTNGTPTPPPATGTDEVTVSAATQPANSLAVQGAARVPFTRVTFTAGSQDVTVNGIHVQKAGLANRSVLSGVVLLDENGTQVGIARTLGSNDQAKVGDPVTIPAGQSRTFTIAGNMASSLAAYAGQVIGLTVTGIDTAKAISGTLPVTGAMHTVNATLSIGSAQVNVSSLDPQSTEDKEIGTTGYTFAGVRVTAGSQEDVILNSVRWNQTGSASSNDLSEVKVVVDGQEFDTTVSADGKYYTAHLGGIVITKGASKDITIKGDIVSGSSRTVKFDIHRATDINISGQEFSYGITPTAQNTAGASDTTSQMTTGTPFFNASRIDIVAGSVTTITRSNDVPAQNIAKAVANQPLGGFNIDAKGEPITVQEMTFTLATSSGFGTDRITNVTLVDQNGTVVAGPMDQAVDGTVKFTDSVTFPTGPRTYTLKGRIPVSAANNSTVQASTNPSNDWVNITGDITGDNLNLTQGNFTMHTMTVKSATANVSVSATPSSQDVVIGTVGHTFARFQYNASGSGEDIRVNSAQYEFDQVSGGSNPVNCFAYDGATRLNNSAVNPSGDNTYNFAFNNHLVVPKGTVKTVDLKCDVPSGTAGHEMRWGISANQNGTGLTSNQSITLTHTAGFAGTMTLQTSGTLNVSLDSTSPSYRVAAAGTTGNTVGVLRFTSTNEAVNVEELGLVLSAATASSSAADFTQVTLWDGATQVGTAIFTGSNTTATTTLSGFTVPANGDKLLTIKADFAGIGTGLPGRNGRLAQIDYRGTAGPATGKGVGSGDTVTATGAATSVDGVRIFKSFPTFAKESAPTNTLSSGERVLYRFRVTADSRGDVGIHQFTANVATTSDVTVTNINVRGYTDAGYTNAISGVSSNGNLMATGQAADGDDNVVITAQTAGGTPTAIQVPAGQTRYFEVVGNVNLTGTGSRSVTTQILGDNAYPAMASCDATWGCMLDAADVVADGASLVWSPNRVSVSGLGAQDWTNGFGVIGLPSSGMTTETLSAN